MRLIVVLVMKDIIRMEKAVQLVQFNIAFNAQVLRIVSNVKKIISLSHLKELVFIVYVQQENTLIPL